MTTRAEQLGITDGLVWVVGRSVEELSLLEPLPDDVETVNERPTSESLAEGGPNTAAAVIVIDDDATMHDDLDEALPQIGSIPLVWVVIAHDQPGVSCNSVSAAALEYGWGVRTETQLDPDWTALRLTPA